MAIVAGLGVLSVPICHVLATRQLQSIKRLATGIIPTTLQKRHVRVTREGIEFDYVAKEGRHRAITVKDQVVLPTVRALASSDNGLDTLFAWERAGAWHTLHSHDVSNYIAARAGAHFTAKEFRTWNATVLMAATLAETPTPASR